MVREINVSDFDGLMQLYTQLNDNPTPEKDDNIIVLWNRILQDKQRHIIVAEEDGKIVSFCVCVIISNLPVVSARMFLSKM